MNTNKLKGSLKTKVETNKDLITFSKFLATIKIDVPITLDMEQLKKEEPDETSLRKIFEELEFRSLADRIFKNIITSPKIEKRNRLCLTYFRTMIRKQRIIQV